MFSGLCLLCTFCGALMATGWLQHLLFMALANTKKGRVESYGTSSISEFFIRPLSPLHLMRGSHGQRLANTKKGRVESVGTSWISEFFILPLYPLHILWGSHGHRLTSTTTFHTRPCICRVFSWHRQTQKGMSWICDFFDFQFIWGTFWLGTFFSMKIIALHQLLPQPL